MQPGHTKRKQESMTTTENPFDTAAPGQSTPAASVGHSEFASPGADLADPFAAPSGGGGGKPFPRCTDLVGRVIALRKLEESMEPNPFSTKEPKELQKIFKCHLVVFTGGMITTTDRRDNESPDAFSLDGSSELPMVEVGEPILLVENWKIWNAGLLNKFGRNNVILGRLVREPKGKQAKETLNTWQKVEAWLATKPAKDVYDKASPFWTLYDVEQAEREAAVAWVRGNSVDAKAFMAPAS
jgi:hypothetical protein